MKNQIETLVLLAGGLATRLRPITEKIPKSLITVAGQPFILHQLALLKSQGVKNIIICTGYLGDMIEKLIGDGSSLDLNIKYSYDGDTLLGTGGSIKKALPFLDEIFFVMYGDSYLDINFYEIADYFLADNKLGLMTVYKNHNQHDKSNVIFDNNKIIEYNKICFNNQMKYIDYGLNIFRKKVFNSFYNQEIFDLSLIHHKLIKEDELIGFEVQKRFYEIGSVEGIKETEDYLAGKKMTLN